MVNRWTHLILILFKYNNINFMDVLGFFVTAIIFFIIGVIVGIIIGSFIMKSIIENKFSNVDIIRSIFQSMGCKPNE